jgi:trehalose 6-phosphate phosphatase
MTEHNYPYDRAADALFLDFDGTLVDLASEPGGVLVSPALIEALQRLQQESGGAIAIVSGRPMDELDHFLKPLRLPLAGVHGAERRTADGSVVQQPVPDASHLQQRLQAFADSHGLLMERKRGAVALHYRHQPHLESLCIETMSAALQQEPGFSMLRGKMVVEAKPHINKGDAIAAFMREAPFRGRRPVFIGDDVTDEAGFAWVQSEVAKGLGIKVGNGATQAGLRVDNPAAVLSLLQQSLTRALPASPPLLTPAPG